MKKNIYVYGVTFADYSEIYYFIASSFETAVKEAREWAKGQRKLDSDADEYLAIDSVKFLGNIRNN